MRWPWVLAMVALRLMTTLAEDTQIAITGPVVAIEGFSSAYNCLLANLQQNGLNGGQVRAIQAVLKTELASGRVCLPSEVYGDGNVESQTDAIVGGCLAAVNAVQGESEAGKRGEDANDGPVAIPRADLIIADLPFVNAFPENEAEHGFFDYRHTSHETLLRAIRGNNWLKPNGRIVTAFSTLGGPEDVACFERLIRADGIDMRAIRSFSYYEASYGWLVYVLMRKEDAGGEEFWQNRLNARLAS